MRQFLNFYGSLGAGGAYVPDGRSGMDPLPGGYRETGRPVARALSAADLMAIGPAAGFPLVFEDIFDMQAPMFQPVGGMDRIAHAIYEQVRAEGAAEQPDHRDPPPRRGRADRPRPGQPGARRGLLHLHPAAEPAAGASRPISRLPSRPRSATTATICQHQGRVRKPALLGGGGDLRRPRLDRPGEREHASIPRTPGIRRRAFWSPPMPRAGPGPNHPAEFAAMSHAERFRVCAASVEAAAPRQVAAARAAGDRVAGGSPPGRRASGRSGRPSAAVRRAARAPPLMRSCCAPRGRSSSPASISPTSPSGRRARRSPPTRRCGC